MTEGVLFIDARSKGVMINRVIRELQKDEIDEIINTVKSVRDNSFESVKGYSAFVDVKDISTPDYSLVPSRYVGLVMQETTDTEPFEDKMNRLAGELDSLWKKDAVLEQQIRSNLSKLGITFN